jgi:ATP synthase F1 epsilon subunit
MNVQVVTTEGLLFEGVCKRLVCTTERGQLCVLPFHTQMICEVSMGEVIVETEHEELVLHVDGGFLEVGKDHNVKLVLDDAIHHYDIDVEPEEQTKNHTEDLRVGHDLEAEEIARTTFLLEKNLSRIQVARRHFHKRKTFSE